MIYFVKAGQFVKIGVSDNPTKRVKELQTGNPYKLELLGTIIGGEQEEAEIHDALSAHHSHGEWYFCSKTVATFIKFALGSPVESIIVENQVHGKDSTILAPPDSRPGWRIEVITRRNGNHSWQWRIGSGENREAAYGGPLNTLPKEEAVKYIRHIRQNKHHLLQDGAKE